MSTSKLQIEAVVVVRRNAHVGNENGVNITGEAEMAPVNNGFASITLTVQAPEQFIVRKSTIDTLKPGFVIALTNSSKLSETSKALPIKKRKFFNRNPPDSQDNKRKNLLGMNPTELLLVEPGKERQNEAGENCGNVTQTKKQTREIGTQTDVTDTESENEKLRQQISQLRAQLATRTQGEIKSTDGDHNNDDNADGDVVEDNDKDQLCKSNAKDMSDAELNKTIQLSRRNTRAKSKQSPRRVEVKSSRRVWKQSGSTANNDLSQPTDNNACPINEASTSRGTTSSGGRVKSSRSEALGNVSVNTTDDMVPIGSGNAKIPARIFKFIDWTSHTIATRKLLTAVFSKKVLATHTLSGKRCPSFPKLPRKKALDVALVDDIVQTIMERCNVRENVVRTTITIKCADESKMLRNRENKKGPKVNKENRSSDSDSD